MWVVAGMAALSVASAVVQKSQQNAGIEDELEMYGMQQADIRITNVRELQKLTYKSASASEDMKAAELQIQANQANAESQAILSAAASDTGGSSTDAVKYETERTAAVLQGSIDNKRKSVELEIAQATKDLFIAGEKQVREPKIHDSTAGSLMSIFSAGVSGALSGYKGTAPGSTLS